MNNKLKLITLVVANTFLLAACQSGSNSGSSQGSTTPITGAHVEADVANGKIYEVREYKVDRNGKTHLTLDGYPHGSYKFRHLDKDKTKLVTYYFTNFKAYSAAKASLDSSYLTAANTAKSTLKSTNPYESGFVIGFNTSINAPAMNSGETGTCYNYSVQATKTSLYSNFAATNASSTNANILNEANDISGSYGLFKGSNQLSYSNNYQGSASDGTYSFTDALTTNVFFTVNSLTPNGENLLAQGADTFVANCGSSIVQTMPMGWMVTLQMQVNSNSASQTSSLKDVLNAGYSSILDVSNQFAESTSNSQTSFGLNITPQVSADYIFQKAHPPINGIQIPANSGLMDLVSEIESSTNLITNCQEGSNPNSASSAISKACSASIGLYSTLVNQALSIVSEDVESSGINQVSQADFFPNAITINGHILTATPNNMAGTATYQPLTTNAPFYDTITNTTAQANFAQISDPYASYGSNLGNYIKLIWNLNQLASAANLYSNIITNNNTSNPLNAQNMPVNTAFSDLGQSYYLDAVALNKIIEPCMENATKCTNLPPLATTAPYDFYNNLSKSPIAINSSVTSNTKAINSLLLQYSANYLELANLGNPNNVWENDDHYYVGNMNPQAKNSVPMQFLYIDSGQVINPVDINGGSLSSGLFGVALSGMTMANPFCDPSNTSECRYENNGSSLQAGPLASGGALLGEIPFYYFLPESQAGVSGLINQNIATGTTLNTYFAPAQKYVSGSATIDYPGNPDLYVKADGNSKVKANIYPTTTTGIYLSPSLNGSTSFAITSYGAGSAGAYNSTNGMSYANGIFGPIGNNGQLYALLNGYNSSNDITGLLNNWVLGLSTLNMLNEQLNKIGCYSGDGAGDNYNSCDGTGLYPYNDSGFTTDYPYSDYQLAGPLSTTITATQNTVTFTKTPYFYQ